MVEYTIPGKKKELKWQYIWGIATFFGESTELGVLKIVNGQRKWHSMTHISDYIHGFWALGSITVFDKTFTGSTNGNNYGYMEVDYRVRYTSGPSITLKTKGGWDVTVSLPLFESDFQYAARTWNTNFNLPEE